MSSNAGNPPLHGAAARGESSRMRADETVPIRIVLERYFHGLDARDADELASCFSPQAAVRYHGAGAEFTLQGGPAIARHLIATVSRFTATVHMLANTVIQVDGEVAKVDSFAIANVVIPDRTLVRGLRYRDVFTQRSGNWTIEERTHEPLWQYEAPTVTPWVPS